MLRTILIAVLAFSITSSAFAAKKEVPGCPVIGIKSTKQYYRANQRQCFANVKKASTKGYSDSAAGSTSIGYAFSLAGTEEVPPVTTTATGSCLAALLAESSTLRVICTHNVISPILAHVHEAAIGVDGDVICDLGAGTSPISADCALTSTQLASLLAGGLYVNVHSTLNSGGEIRGQID